MLAAGLAVSSVIAPDVRAQGRDSAAPTGRKGVTHQLYVAVGADRISAGANSTDQEARVTLTVLLRISDHAREANFFGPVLASFVDLPLGEQSPEQKAWEDKMCHQDRGLPRLVLIGLNGLIKDAGRDLAISAQPRRIGKHLPVDEIVMAQAFTAGDDQRGAFVMMQGTTLQSRITIRVKLYTSPCSLSGLADH